MKAPRWWWWLKVAVIVFAFYVWMTQGANERAVHAVSSLLLPVANADDEVVTYRGQVAGILNESCGVCHRPGGAGPFSLLSYDDARRRATLISAVTASRYMPPWQPAQRDELFANARSLTDEEIAALGAWARAGAPEGAGLPVPEPPEFVEGWQLGEPDLVLEVKEPYELRADGVDVFRNLVLPIDVPVPRYVKAVEFQPGNPRVVHHAIMQVDRTRSSRERDAEDEGVGFGGMDVGPAENPGGQFIGWTPGKVAVSDERLAWRVDPGTDLVVQLHLLPSGKPEKVAPRVGLYFADRPPSLHPVSLVLRNDDILIPPGEAAHVIEDDLTIPVPVDVIGIYPHAHYIGRSVAVWATLPDGRRQALIDIPNWDFNWQDDYRYRSPLRLPAGTRIDMRYTYDNSATNVRNPNNPPQTVRFGNQSSDEMATLTLQVLPASETDSWRLTEASARRRLERRPDSWFLHNLLGSALNELGQHEGAARHFGLAVQRDPGNPSLVFNLGNSYLARGDYERAVTLYRQALDIDERHPQVRNNLAIALQGSGDVGGAVTALREQLAISPRDARVHYNLGVGLLAMGQAGAAVEPLSEAARLDPTSSPALEDLGEAHRLSGDARAARAAFQAALALDQEATVARLGMGLLDVEYGSMNEGLASIARLLQRDPNLAVQVNAQAWRWATESELSVRRTAASVELTRLALRHFPGTPELLDTLAAAQAANGQPEAAVATITRAIEGARATSSAKYIPEFEARRALYRAGGRYTR